MLLSLSAFVEDSGGAPGWIVTFADMMSLLLCFFVLLLSFSVMDAEKFKAVANSLREAFSEVAVPGATSPAPNNVSDQSTISSNTSTTVKVDVTQERLNLAKEQIDNYVKKEQLDQFIQSPLTTSLRWFTTLLSDSLDVVFLAWGQPLSSLLTWIWSRNQLLLGLGLSVASVVVALFVLKPLEGPDENDESNWHTEALWLGTAGVIGGLLPIILVNRFVDFGFYSRYTLVSSTGAAILLVSLVFSLHTPFLRNALLASFVFFASLTHFANSQKAVQITDATRGFWWQVYWRAPQIAPHTTLIANYAVGATEEDYFVWGPANLIYYSEGTKEKYVQPGIYAAVLNRDTVTNVLVGKGQEFDNRRTIRTYKNYRNILILTQPTASSCVHVLDGGGPEYSTDENASIQIIGPYSNLDYVLTDETVPAPPSIVFGPEPEHDWCYYYQKATLARQRGDWDAILSLGEEASRKDLAPLDLIEWMPFLQAYAITGDIHHLVELAPVIASDSFITLQACQNLGRLQNLTASVLDVIDAQYCDR